MIWEQCPPHPSQEHIQPLGIGTEAGTRGRRDEDLTTVSFMRSGWCAASWGALKHHCIRIGGQKWAIHQSNF